MLNVRALGALFVQHWLSPWELAQRLLRPRVLLQQVQIQPLDQQRVQPVIASTGLASSTRAGVTVSEAVNIENERKGLSLRVERERRNLTFGTGSGREEKRDEVESVTVSRIGCISRKFGDILFSQRLVCTVVDLNPVVLRTHLPLHR